MSDKIKVTLSATALEVNAGESVELTATIHNRSQVVDQLGIRVDADEEPIEDSITVQNLGEIYANIMK